MSFKLTGRIMKNLIKYYWHIILLCIVILWVVFSYIASVSAWKAVFLDNTQVYFGHYTHIPFTRFATLRDVYFLREEGTTAESAVIVPLTAEPHGPKGYMKINMDHVVGIHILRPDSTLVKTIEEIEKDK
jgi:hypothetical protein